MIVLEIDVDGVFTLKSESQAPAELNTEMGVVIESPTLAKRVDTAFAGSIPANAYEVRLTEGGKLYWLERRGGQLLRHDIEPGTRFLGAHWRRLDFVLTDRLAAVRSSRDATHCM